MNKKQEPNNQKKIVTGNILMPWDKGYNQTGNPWGWIRNVAGLHKPDKVQVHIVGYILLDCRMDPHKAIFKNMVVDSGRENEPFIVKIDEPVPFESLREASMYKAKMHLSQEDDPKVRFVALAPDQGMETPQPNVIFVPRDEINRM